jgi:hypothetical protein
MGRYITNPRTLVGGNEIKPESPPHKVRRRRTLGGGAKEIFPKIPRLKYGG